MHDLNYSDEYLRDILRRTKTIAAVGVSKNTVRPSWFVSNYMNVRGFSIIPVNPGFSGETLFGRTVYPDLANIDISEGEVHMVDIFRRSEHVQPIVEMAIEHLMDRGLKTIWMQIGVVNQDAARLAENAGLKVIMNKCPKMEHQRLSGELSRGGVVSGQIGSKLR